MNSLQIKKRALIMGNSFKGYPRENGVEEANTITLTNCMRQKPIGIDIYGSANGVGDFVSENRYRIPITVTKKRNNILISNEFRQGSPTAPINSTNYDYYSIRATLLYPLSVEAGKTYYISSKNVTNDIVFLLQTATGYDAETGVYSGLVNQNNGLLRRLPITFTATSTGYIVILARKTNGSSINAEDVTNMRLMVNEGGTALPYEDCSLPENHSFNLYIPSQLSVGDGVSLPEASTTSILMVKPIKRQAIMADGYTEVQEIGASSPQREYLNQTDVSDIQDWDSIERLYKGTNIITVGTENTPSEIDVKYYSSEESV